jgi:hypothetical protein
MIAALGMILTPQLVSEVAHIGAGADRRGDPMVGVTLQVVDIVLSGEVRLRHGAVCHVEKPEMAVRIDDRGHDGLPRQVDACCARRHIDLAVTANRCEPIVLHDKRGVLNRRAAIAGDEPRTFEHRNSRRRGSLACALRTPNNDGRPERHRQARDGELSTAHFSLLDPISAGHLLAVMTRVDFDAPCAVDDRHGAEGAAGDGIRCLCASAEFSIELRKRAFKPGACVDRRCRSALRVHRLVRLRLRKSAGSEHALEQQRSSDRRRKNGSVTNFVGAAAIRLADSSIDRATCSTI